MNTMADALLKAGKVKEKDVHRTQREKKKADDLAWKQARAAMPVYTRFFELIPKDTAIDIAHEIELSKVRPDAESIETMIEALEQAQSPQEAHAIAVFAWQEWMTIRDEVGRR